ncbi:MAG: lytic transglycosylase domain-containing protein [Proteobacteria bacterium]|nr:lytic transglycosylase domain-containing protein [Pseudomonadota bacterium]
MNLAAPAPEGARRESVPRGVSPLHATDPEMAAGAAIVGTEALESPAMATKRSRDSGGTAVTTASPIKVADDVPHALVFRTSGDGLLPVAVKPVGKPERAIDGTAIRYARNGITFYTTTPPAQVASGTPFIIIGNCYACDLLPGVRFDRMALNTSSYAVEISVAARAYGIDEGLIRAIIHAESDFNPNAVSDKGAQGLMQLMPVTAARFGVRDAFAAADNIRGGAQYLAFLSRRYCGDIALIAAAYDAGEANVDRYNGVPPFAETQRYVERVATLAERYRSAH